MKNDQLNKFLEKVILLNLYSTNKRLLFKLQDFFENTKLKNKKILDVGGGYGLLSLYAAIMGADNVVCLEPETDGSSSGSQMLFYQLKEDLQIENVKLCTLTFQEHSENEKYDIIILHNSVNHLDENSCVNFSTDPTAYNVYKELFAKMNRLLNNDGLIILSDCSRYNFWDLIGLKNPFDFNIEWPKHQSPFKWRKLLNKTGFEVQKIKWSSFNRFHHIGKFLLGNLIFAYFLTSHFTIYARKNENTFCN